MDWLSNLRIKNIFQPQENQWPAGIIPFNPNAPAPTFGDTDITPEIRPFGKPDALFQAGPVEVPQVNPFETPQAPVPNAGLSDVARRMQAYYTPEEEMSNRMESMLNQFPTREKPGWLRKIGAALVAGTTRNAAAGREILDRPYNRKLKDWQDQFDPTYKAATLERQQNVNERTLAYQTIAAEIREEQARAKAENDAAKTEIARKRAAVYEFKAKNPGARIVSPKGGFVTAIDPITNKATIVKDEMGKPIPTGSLTDEDMQNLQHDNRMAEIEKRGDIESGQIEQRGDIESRHITERGAEARTTQAAPRSKAAGEGDDGELPTQTRVRQFNAARELYNSKPQYRKWIKIGDPGSSDFRITPPGKPNFFGQPTGPTEQEYKEINDYIYGRSALVPSHKPGDNKTPRQGVTRRTVRNKTTGQTKTQISTDGGKTWKDE